MRNGFSLVELSIVLVILGLSTGGILAGQSLIRASELRSVSSDYQRYSAAVHTFRDKYFGVPGDFRDATRFWLRQVNTADCVNNSSAAVNAAGTCDGNGDGTMAQAGALSASGENFQFWRQLALAGLIEGTYTGLAGPTAGNTGNDNIIGTNCPRSRLSNAGWSVRGLGSVGTANLFTLDYGNMFMIGGQAVGDWTSGQILKPEEAWNIDTKIDDGKPAAGKVIGVYYPVCTNAASGTDYSSNYALSTTTSTCVLAFTRQF